MRARRAGFTLVELLVSLAVGSLALVAAAKIAAIGVVSSGRGEQSNEMLDRVRLMGIQLRTDLALAGLGSNGIIGVQPANWGFMAGTAIITAQGRTALPAVRGVNNVAAGVTIGGVTVQRGSDILQVIVPDADPARTWRTRSTVLTGVVDIPLDLPLATPAVVCPFVYVLDHGAPNGGGRTQLARGAPAGPNATIRLGEPLLFPLTQGAEIMCARISTYWVDNNDQLHRTDLALPPGPPAVAIGATGLWTSPLPSVAAPGIVDLQLAFVFGRSATGVSAANHTLGAAAGAGPYPGAGPTAADWGELRAVRYTLVGRSLRQVVNPGGLIDIPLHEDRAPGLVMRPRTFTTHVAAGGAELTNLRYFDELADANVALEPY